MLEGKINRMIDGFNFGLINNYGDYKFYNNVKIMKV